MIFISAYKIISLPQNRADDCENILRSLPDWFGLEHAIVRYRKDIEVMPTYVVIDNDDIIAFITIYQHYESSTEIHVMAVRQEYHRRGIGKAMVSHVENILREKSVQYLQVKTLSPSDPDKNYAKTRKFYEALSFKPLEEFKTLWDKNNPCLLMVKKL